MSRTTRILYETFVHSRRVRVLGSRLAALIPHGASVLDVGSGDGLLALTVQFHRPDVRVGGVDVMVRDQTFIPVERFDGRAIPYEDSSVDVVLFSDVLHHADDATQLLREAVRVTRSMVLIKDHLREGILAGPTLRFMDYIGNAHHGVSLPYNYWSRSQWLGAFEALGLDVRSWQDDLGLYGPAADWLFGRSLHFIAQLGLSR